jgi:hypothetical protein
VPLSSILHIYQWNSPEKQRLTMNVQVFRPELLLLIEDWVLRVLRLKSQIVGSSWGHRIYQSQFRQQRCEHWAMPKYFVRQKRISVQIAIVIAL